MAVDAVFISSVVEGFEEVRSAAAAAISASGLHPIQSEDLSADPVSPQRALLDHVAVAEYYLLLMGARYGNCTPDGTSPTEDEYAEAARLGKPILVLAQDTEFEPRQRQFLEHIRGNWGEGVFYGTFIGAGDVGAKVAEALARQRSAIAEDAPTARERALALAAEESRPGWNEPATVRVVFAPLRRTTLLDPITLEDLSLADDLVAALRASGAISQSVGIAAHISSEGIGFGPGPQQSGPQARICADGAIAIASSVAAEGMLGGMQIDPDRLASLLSGAGRGAQLIWDRIDVRSEIGQIAITAAVLDAQHLAYGSSSTGSVSLGGTIPATVIAPDPPAIAPRAQLDKDAVSRQVLAAIRRVFADVGRVQQ